MRPAPRNIRLLAPPANDKYQRRYGSDLDPVTVSNVLSAADKGYMFAMADMLDEIRETDPHLQAVMFKREVQVAGARYTIQAAPNSGPRGQKIADFVTDALSRARNLRRAFAHLQGGVFHGRAVVETVWAMRKTRIVPARFEVVHPRRINISSVTNWLLHVWDESGGAGSDSRFRSFPGVPVDDPVVFPYGKLIVHTPHVRGGYVTREGLGRLMVWFAVFKRWGIRDWMALAEMAGRPGRLGYHSTGKNGDKAADVRDIDKLEQALDDWSSAVSVVLPDTVKVEFVQALRSEGQLHDRLVRFCDEQMSKAALGGTLTTDAGTKGARSLGDTHQDEQQMIALWDAAQLQETIGISLIEPMVVFNFGPSAPMPHIVFEVVQEETLDAVALRLKTLKDAGLQIPSDYVYEKFNIPRPNNADANKQLVAPTDPGAGNAAANQPVQPRGLPAPAADTEATDSGEAADADDQSQDTP